MKTKKEKNNKILKIIFFVVFSFLIIYPFFQTEARTTTTIGDYYENPNRGPLTDYSFNLENIINANLLTQVVGCTGIIDTVSSWMALLPGKMVDKLKDKGEKALYEQLQNACASLKAGSTTAAGTVPQVNDLTTTVQTLFSKITGKIGEDTAEICAEKVISKNLESYKEQQKILAQLKKDAIVEQCFNGIAITLAKNQLTAMTKSTMNWVNTGFGGNPFYVQNVSGFMNKIERNVVETGIDALLSPGRTSPYAKTFVNSTLRNSDNLFQSSANALSNLYSDLGNFITDTDSYYSKENQGRAQDTDIALMEAERANMVFNDNFLSGGWDAWMALTQKEQNNPLGYTMRVSQIMADETSRQKQEKQNELTQNAGFLSQKECVLWQIYNSDGTLKYTEAPTGNTGLMPVKVVETSKIKPTPVKGQDGYGECVEWKTITPGSLIKDKVSNYLTSPERQLELAKTINDGLNALFSILLEKLQIGGLRGLSDSNIETSNWSDNLNVSDDYYSFNNNGAYVGFNLTRDLGNTFYRLGENEIVKLGGWDAKNNITETKIQEKLYANKAPLYIENIDNAKYRYYVVSVSGKSQIVEDVYHDWEVGDRAFWNGERWQKWERGEENPVVKKTNSAGPITVSSGDIEYIGKWDAGKNIATNTNSGATEKLYMSKAPTTPKKIYMYYEVTTAGDSKIIDNSHNRWEIGDRAFWDGEKWQNWKKDQINPIKNRGVSQIQSDYLVAAKELIGILPGVTKSLAELDYCIPGPNPNYKINSSDAQSAYQDWVGSMFVGPKDMYRTEWRIDHEDSRTYQNLAEIYLDTPEVWKSITKSNDTSQSSDNFMWLLDNFDRQWGSVGLPGFWDPLKNNAWKWLIPVWGAIATITDATKNQQCTDGFCCVANYTDSDNGARKLAYDNYKTKNCLNYHYDKNELPTAEKGNVENRKATMNAWLDYVNTGLFNNFFDVFDKMMNSIYFDNITKKYIENEHTTQITENPTYIEMAERGLSYVKSLSYYDELTKEAIEKYKNSISETQTNIIRLKSIEERVSVIIKEAQDRRNEKLKDKADAEGLTLAKYLEKYQACIDEENISFFDPSKILMSSATKEERCSDGIDNDLDGLIDMDDPDCQGSTTRETGREGEENRRTTNTRP